MDSEVYGYGSSSGKSNKFLWIMFFGVIFIAIFVGVYFLLASKAVSETKLVEGTSLELGANNSVKLKTGDGEEHNLEVNFVGLDSVDITISSDPIEIKGLKVNEIRKVDLNDDGVADLWIKLVSIKDGKAVIAVKKIEENVCEEDWECEAWSACVLGSQGRDCVDKNSCGTIENRPELTRSCEETLENTSVENQSETGELINETNQSEIVNATNETTSPLENETGVLDCGIFNFASNDNSSIDCFINSSETCTPVRVLVKTSANVFDIAYVESAQLKEIKGLEDGKCEYYTIIQSYDLNYTKEGKQALIDQGYNESEIPGLEEEEEALYIGLNDTCSFELDDLITLLTHEKEGHFSSEDWDVAVSCQYGVWDSSVF